MKILHVCPLYYPVVGGVENVFRSVSEGMVRRGEDVTVFTTTGRSFDAFFNPAVKALSQVEEIINGVKVHRFPYRCISRLMARTVSYGWSMLHLPKDDMLKTWSALPWVPNLSKEIVNFKPDIVLAGHFRTRLSIDACRARNMVGFPLIFHTALHLDIETRLSELTIKRLNMGDALWVNTSYEKETLISYGIDESKILELGVGVNPEDFKYANGNNIRERYKIGSAPLVLFVGRKEKDKGVITVIKAMEPVWKKSPDAKLILAGVCTRPSEKRQLNEFVKKHNKSVISIDVIRDEEKKDLYEACDIFVMPSRIDSFGIVFLEAWVSGKPVIGADIGSSRSIITDGEDGYLVHFGDVETLAKRIIFLLEHPRVRREMGKCGKEKALKRYTWDHIIDTLLCRYKALVNKKEI